MRTLTVAISDVEYSRFGIANDELNFSDFVDLVSRELMKQHLDAAVNAADICGLSSMTMDDITGEVRSARQNAKSNS
ncbi:MAG: hypothetical protein Pg6C_20270 [Treponemataceae bacterium]|jgi:hypothetical protein|nr:MAG: hypothetical protein Pg6C_20270 [Treponemataceae bacterium]